MELRIVSLLAIAAGPGGRYRSAGSAGVAGTGKGGRGAGTGVVPHAGPDGGRATQAHPHTDEGAPETVAWPPANGAERADATGCGRGTQTLLGERAGGLVDEQGVHGGFLFRVTWTTMPG